MTKPNIPENKTIPIAESGNQGGIRMWPSEEWASKLADWANFGLIASLIAGVISTVLLVWMGNVKEGYLKAQLGTTSERAAHAEERAANVEAGNIQLRTDLSKQQERAAKAEKELLELKERIKARHLTPEQQKTLAAKLRAFAGQKINVVAYGGDDEISGIAKEIIAALGPPNGAQWNITHISGGAPTGNIGGILIEVEPNASGSVQEAATALAVALRAEHLAVTGPEVGSGAHNSIGATITGTLRIGDSSIITMTIAKKP